MILLQKGISAPVAPLFKEQGQCLRHAPVSRRPWTRALLTDSLQFVLSVNCM